MLTKAAFISENKYRKITISNNFYNLIYITIVFIPVLTK